MNADANLPTWAVVMTVNEPKELVLANVAHHLSLGASEVFVFLDAPDPELESLLSAHGRCHVTVCDETYWAENHDRSSKPIQITARQTLNSGLAAQLTFADWLVSLDADEFVYCDTDFREVLADVPKKAGWLKLAPWERRLDMRKMQTTIFDGFFIGLPDDAEVEGTTQGGFTGHVVGKSCVRMGRGYSITAHNPRIGPIKDKKIPPSSRDPRAFLLHFDGLTPYHWGYKLLFRAARGVEYIKKNNFGKRRRQIGIAAMAAQDDAALTKLLNEIGGLTEQEISDRKKANLVRELDLGIAVSVAAHYPNVDLNFSAEHYDRRIEHLFEDTRSQVVAMGNVWKFTQR